MFTIHIDTAGLTKYAEKLTIFANLLPGVTYDKARDELQQGVDVVKTYPPSHGLYKRTGTYGRSTNLVASPFSGGTARFQVISAAVEAKRGRHYSSYVGGTAVGSPGAPQVIKYGWRNIYDEIVRKRLPRIVGNVDSAIQALATKLGVK